MGVGIKGESSGEMSQHSADRLDIYAVLQGNGGEIAIHKTYQIQAVEVDPTDQNRKRRQFFRFATKETPISGTKGGNQGSKRHQIFAKNAIHQKPWETFDYGIIIFGMNGSCMGLL